MKARKGQKTGAVQNRKLQKPEATCYLYIAAEVIIIIVLPPCDALLSDTLPAMSGFRVSVVQTEVEKKSNLYLSLPHPSPFLCSPAPHKSPEAWMYKAIPSASALVMMMILGVFRSESSIRLEFLMRIRNYNGCQILTPCE